jgi:hypothetical protein
MSNLDEFDTVIRRKSGAAIAAVPRLGLYAQGPDVASALAALEQKKTALVADIDAGLVDADLISKPEQVQLRNARASNVGVFALKTGIFIVLATLGALVAATLISAKLEAAIDRVRFAAESTFYQAVEGSFWTKIEGFIERAADPGKEPSPERKQKLEQNIRTLADRWRPIVTEALSVFTPEKSARMDVPAEKSATTENDAKPAQ